MLRISFSVRIQLWDSTTSKMTLVWEGPGHDPKIVDAFQTIHFRKCFGDGGSGLVHLWIVGFNRVHVSDEFDAKRVLHLPLYIVDDIVVGHDIAACIHFDMSGRKDLSGSVVMHHQIVDAKDAGISAYDLPNAFHQMGIRGFPRSGLEVSLTSWMPDQTINSATRHPM